MEEVIDGIVEHFCKVEIANVPPGSSPGFPLMLDYASNSDIFDSPLAFDLFKRLFRDRLVKIVNTDFENMSPLELVKAGLCDPMRVFGKNEPHKIEKIETGRLRMIMSVSLIDNAMHRIVSHPCHLAEKINACPSMIGANLKSPEQCKELIDSVFGQSEYVVFSNDMSGWDHRVEEAELDVACRARLLNCNPDRHWIFDKLVKFMFYSMARKVFLFSDGSMIEQLDYGILPSGWFCTGNVNGEIRTLAAIRGGAVDCFNMGDDCIERWPRGTVPSDLVRHYTSIGKKVTDVRDCIATGVIDFCSKEFHKNGKIYPHITKAWFNLLNQDLNGSHARYEFWTQFCLELCDIDPRPFYTFLLKNGWFEGAPLAVPNIVLQSGPVGDGRHKYKDHKDETNMVRRKNMRINADAKRLGSIPPSLHTIIAPFDAYDARWPDDTTALSGTAVTRTYLRTSFSPLDGGSATTHAGGILMLPHPTISYCKLVSRATPYDSAANKGLTDIGNTAGTSTSNWNAAQNLNGLIGGATSADFARIRCVGMGIRVEYLGTELNRAGRFMAGNLLMAQQPTTFATTGTKYSALSSTGNGNADQYVTDIRQAMTSCVEARDPDGVLEAHWIPNGVPSYQLCAGQVAYTDTAFTTGAGGGRAGTDVQTYFTAGEGKFGVQGGQNALCWVFEGDVTTASQVASNDFGIEMIWHWEVIPNEPFSVVYALNPSPYVPEELAAVINHMQVSPVGYVSKGAVDYGGNSVTGSTSGLQQAGKVTRSNPTIKNVFSLLRTAYNVGSAVANAVTGNYVGAARAAYTVIEPLTRPKQVKGKKVLMIKN